MRTDKPQTLEEVRRRGKTDFPFPDSSHDIYYAVFGDWQSYECLIRFDAPPADCEAAVATILAWHKSAMHSSTPYQARPFSGPIANSSFLHPVPWFDAAVITRGLYAGEDASHTPNIWVDLDAGRFYFRSTD